MARSKSPQTYPGRWRQIIVMLLVFAGFGVLGLRVVNLQLVEHEHLRKQGDARYLREVVVQPERGRILDRNGQVISVSTPVDSVTAEPAVFCQDTSKWKSMARVLNMEMSRLQKKCADNADSEFMYISRRISPTMSEEVMALEIPGIALEREYKRYYPGGPVSAHLVGFTDIDDQGQEGLELSFDSHLKGTPGRERVLKDLVGHYVESVESIQQVQDGEDLIISVDQRVQSLAAGYLESAIKEHGAKGGSIVVLSIPDGEIVSMVNSPQFNPNDRSTIKNGAFRNRAVTDLLEPGSTAKPFTIAMALESKKVDPDTMVDTKPGRMAIGSQVITDVKDYGEISVSDVLVHSSNVGSAKIALAFEFEELFDIFKSVGFGTRSSQLPGESTGVLVERSRPIEHATLSYGYGFSVTPLQLARAYTVFATDGVLLPVSFYPKNENQSTQGERILKKKTVEQIRPMLEMAASPDGTARKARIPRYRVAGKTGTTHKLVDGNYKNKNYISSFAGFAPVSNPRFVMVVVVDEPTGDFHYGGDVAAPVFSNLMQDLMRLYNVPPDNLPEVEITSTNSQEESA